MGDTFSQRRCAQANHSRVLRRSVLSEGSRQVGRTVRRDFQAGDFPPDASLQRTQDFAPQRTGDFALHRTWDYAARNRYTSFISHSHCISPEQSIY